MEDTKAVKEILESLQGQIKNLDTTVDDTILKKNLNELLFDLNDSSQQAKSEILKCKLLNAYAYIISSLYFSFLKADGNNRRNDHPIMDELKRVKSYIGRINAIQHKQEVHKRKEETSLEEAQKFINSNFGGSRDRDHAAISRVQFEGEHKRFPKSMADPKLQNTVKLSKNESYRLRNEFGKSGIRNKSHKHRNRQRKNRQVKNAGHH